jgi:hypothetical protein
MNSEVSIHLISQFKEIFVSDGECYYGQYIPEKIDTEKNKEIGKYYTNKGAVTEQHIKEHLEGRVGLGIVPITYDNKSRFGVIDIDDYDTNHLDFILDMIFTYNIPLFPFRSKSGGLHIYLFFKQELPSKYVRDIMLQFARLFGLHKKTEIFPKQVTIENKAGSWINLPYYNTDQRYLYNSDKGPYSILEAFDLILNSKTTKSDIELFFDNLPLNDAPPCLQTLYFQKDITFRNNYMFNMAVYHKSKFGDEFEDHLVTINGRLQDPIGIEELVRTIITSHKKKNYSYKCNEQPICDFCSKSECKKKKYGIGSGLISELSFEELIQYMSDPPHYGWKINSKELKFFNESDIINQTTFREMCFRELHILPVRLSDIKWTEVINTATNNMQIKEINPEDDISPGQMLKDYMVEFFEHRAIAKNKEQITMDKIFKDEDKKYYVFKPKNLLAFLIYQKQFRYFGQTEIQDRLRKMGAEPTKYYVNQDIGSIRVWTLPYTALEKYKHKIITYTEEFKLEDLYDEKKF